MGFSTSSICFVSIVYQALKGATHLAIELIGFFKVLELLLAKEDAMIHTSFTNEKHLGIFAMSQPSDEVSRLLIECVIKILKIELAFVCTLDTRWDIFIFKTI